MPKNNIRFTKMHGLGNDFVMIDGVNQSIDSASLPISLLGNRHFGVGFDQLIIVESAKAASADFFCRIFNADGSEAEQCGNGLRCAARFIRDNKLHADSISILKLETRAGIFEVTIHNNEKISMLMGVPVIIEKKLMLPLGEKSIGPLCVISLGNPHAILSVNSLDIHYMKKIGEQISSHPYFKNGINAGLMYIVNSHHIRLITIERGAGETYACGSNASAAAVAAILLHGLEPSVQVEFQYGTLTIEWPNQDGPVKMTGPAETVFSGEWFLSSEVKI